MSLTKASYSMINGAPINVLDFGADNTGSTDSTSAIQAAINYVSNSDHRTLYFPAGTYNFTRLYCYYDAALNPGYNVNRNAKLTIQGDGTLPEVNGVCGTILNCTSSTGDGLIVSGYAEDALPYKSRDFNMRDITIQGAPSGYLLVLSGVVQPHLEYIKIVQNNAAGSGMYISTAFFATLEKMQFANYGVGTKTGDAIRFDSGLPAGLFTMRDCNINGYGTGLYKGSGPWQNISIYDSEIAAASISIYIGGGTLDLLNIQGCYFESEGSNFISVYPEFGLNSLNVNGSWFFSRFLTGRAIDLRRMGSVTISGCYVLDQYTEFLNIDDSFLGYAGGAFTVNGVEFNYITNPTSDVYYFVGGKIPALYAVDYPASISFCKLTDINARPIRTYKYGSTGNALLASNVCSTMTYNAGTVTAATINLGSIVTGCPSFVIGNFATTPSNIELPATSAGYPQGFSVTITSDSGSSSTVAVKRDSSDGGATLATLSAGQQRTFVLFNDGTLNNWY